MLCDFAVYKVLKRPNVSCELHAKLLHPHGFALWAVQAPAALNIVKVVIFVEVMPWHAKFMA